MPDKEDTVRYSSIDIICTVPLPSACNINQRDSQVAIHTIRDCNLAGFHPCESLQLTFSCSKTPDVNRTRDNSGTNIDNGRRWQVGGL